MLRDTSRQVKAIKRLMPHVPATSANALSRKFEHRPKELVESSLTGYSVKERQGIQMRLLCGSGFVQDIAALDSAGPPAPVVLSPHATPGGKDTEPEPEAGAEMKDPESANDEAVRSDGVVSEEVMPEYEPLVTEKAPVKKFIVGKLRFTDWITGIDAKYLRAHINRVPLEDQFRVEQYLSHRPLGIGILTAGPGFGKTFLLSVATLCMNEKEGKVLASGPSNKAVSNFAKKLDELEQEAVRLCNTGLKLADLARLRRKLIIRGYKPKQELKAFLNLLNWGGQIRHQPNRAAGNGKWSIGSPWELELSTAQFLLAAWGSPLAGRNVGR